MTTPTPEQASREALEAVIRRQLGNIVKRPHTANECSDAMLAAADAYAADEVKAALEIARRVPLTTVFGHRYTAIPDSGEVELHCGSHAPEAVTWKVGYHPSLDVLIGQATAHDAAEHNNDSGAAEDGRLRARAEAGETIIRDTLESLCKRDGLSLESAVVPGEPARNYELADRLGIGGVFGLQPQSAAPAGPQPARGLDGQRRRIDQLHDLIRDVLQAFPDTAGEQEWRDRAGRLDVRDPDGQPYRARTEEDL